MTSRLRRAGIHGRHRGDAVPHPRWLLRSVYASKAVAALVAAGLLLGFGYGWYNYRTLDNGVQRLHLTNLAGGPEQVATAVGSSAPPKQTGEEQNFLVVGIDSRAGMTAQQRRLLHTGNDDSLSTDTMMIIHVPADGSKATIISLPRDSYVDIPGHKKSKLNAAYADGYTDGSGSDLQRTAAGADLLIAAVHQLTGVNITHYVQVGFIGFYNIAKVIGGIPVDLCHAVDDTFAHNRAEGQTGGSGFVMSAGKHELTPVQTLEFVRQRHFLRGGDLARVERQRYFIAAAFNKIASVGLLLDPGKLHRLIDAITGSFYMDDKKGSSILALAQQLANLSASNIVGHTIPTSGFEQVPGVGDVDVVDPAGVRAYVSELLSPAPASRSARAPSASNTPGGSVARHTATPAATTGCIN